LIAGHAFHRQRSLPDPLDLACFTTPLRGAAYRFPLVVETVAGLRARSAILDGDAVCCDEDGVPSFDRIRYRRHNADVFLYGFDLLGLNGDGLRREPLEVRKATLA
jgi:bifunctional non-homologous end joining protein LigD